MAPLSDAYHSPHSSQQLGYDRGISYTKFVHASTKTWWTSPKCSPNISCWIIFQVYSHLTPHTSNLVTIFLPPTMRLLFALTFFFHRLVKGWTPDLTSPHNTSPRKGKKHNVFLAQKQCQTVYWNHFTHGHQPEAGREIQTELNRGIMEGGWMRTLSEKPAGVKC